MAGTIMRSTQFRSIVEPILNQAFDGVYDQRVDEYKKIFTEVTQEAAAKSTADIIKREKELEGEFKQKGLTVTGIDRVEFLEAVNKNTTFEQFGYRKSDWEKIQAIK